MESENPNKETCALYDFELETAVSGLIGNNIFNNIIIIVMSTTQVPSLTTDISCVLYYIFGKILERWADHFNSVLNLSSIKNEPIDRLPQAPTNEALDDSPTLLETQPVIKLYCLNSF